MREGRQIIIYRGLGKEGDKNDDEREADKTIIYSLRKTRKGRKRRAREGRKLSLLKEG